MNITEAPIVPMTHASGTDTGTLRSGRAH